MKLISACLVGLNCRYDGKNSFKEEYLDLVLSGKAITICPEVMGGLTTPRPPAEIVGESVLTQFGFDVTEEFKLGAEKVLELAKKYNVDEVVLKSKSPSCGIGEVYDGTFSRVLISGDGITSKLLIKNGIKVKKG